MVKVAGANKENEVVLAMMAKMNYTLKTTGKPGVSSVFTNGIKGMVYIESRNEIDAKKLIEGLNLVKAWSFKLVRFRLANGACCFRLYVVCVVISFFFVFFIVCFHRAMAFFFLLYSCWRAPLH